MTTIGAIEPVVARRGSDRSDALLDRFDLMIVALLALCYVGVATLPFAPKKFGDGDFQLEAKTLAAAVRGATAWSEVAIIKAPGPVIYYGLPYLAIPPGSSDDTYWFAAFVWTTGWMALSILLIRRTATLLAGELAGRVAAVLSLASPFSVYYSYGVVAEPPAFLGVVLLAYGWARWKTSSRADTRALRTSPVGLALWVATAGLSLFVLSRPNAFLIAPLAAAAAAACWFFGPRARRRDAIFAATCMLLSGTVIAAFLFAANALQGRRGETGQISYLAHTTFPSRFQYRTEPWDWRFWDDTTRQGSTDYAAWDSEVTNLKRQSVETGVPLSTLQFQWMLNDIIQHPMLTVRMSLIRLLSLHMTFVNSAKPASFSVGPISGQLVYRTFHTIVNTLNLAIVTAALWFLVTRRHQAATLWPLWGPWLGLLIFHVMTYAEPRYLFGGRPGQIIMAAVALTPLVGRYATRHTMESQQE